MSTIKHEIRSGAYFDSVILMQLQRALVELDGVDDAGAVMATPANKELLAANGLLPDDVMAKNDDLLLVVKAESETAASHALARVDELLKRRRSRAAQDFRPRSLRAAAAMLPVADWVLVSVPGRYAKGVADEALDLGKHVFLYSDNVPLADEVALKQKARKKGLLVMGPDCGTAVINGIGLGFANRVRRGRIGIVAASGTGLQAVASEIHNLGAGVSQAIGAGGRDLKADVGAITAHQALGVLAGDDATGVIVLISKPPSAAVTTQLLQAAQATDKPVVVDFLGFAPPSHQIGNLHFARSLCETAEMAVQIGNMAEATTLSHRRHPLEGHVRGLFSGGTLAYEALLGLQAVVHPIYSNIPVRPEQALDDVHESKAHTILDMGEDEFTQGRLHPMMDNDLRLRRLRKETADADVTYIMLDVVLGEGAHPDPAAELAPAIADAVAADKRVLAVVIGTNADPQQLESQIERLIAAGARVFSGVNEAVDYVFNRVPPPEYEHPAVALDAFGGELAAINVGLESFYDSLTGQGAEAVHVDWRPPAGGNEKLMGILAKMKSRG